MADPTSFWHKLQEKSVKPLDAICIMQQISERMLSYSVADFIGPPISDPANAASLIFVVKFEEGCISNWEELEQDMKRHTDGKPATFQLIIENAFRVVIILLAKPGRPRYEMMVLFYTIFDTAKSKDGEFDGNLVKMVGDLRQAVEKLGKFEECSLSWKDGDACFNQKDYSAAIKHYQVAAQFCPDSLHLYLGRIHRSRGNCFNQLKQCGTSINEFTTALGELDAATEGFIQNYVQETRADCLAGRITAFLAVGDFMQATNDFIKSLLLDYILLPPSSPNIEKEEVNFFEFTWSKSTVTQFLSIAEYMVETFKLSDRTSMADKTDSSLQILDRLRINGEGGVDLSIIKPTEINFWSLANIVVLLLSLEMIPLLRSCPNITKPRALAFRKSLYGVPHAIVKFMSTSTLETEVMVKRLVKMVEDAEKSLWQTAAAYIRDEQFGKSTIVHTQICIHVAKEYSNIAPEFGNVEHLLNSVQVRVDGYINYSQLRRAESSPGLSIEAARQCIGELSSQPKQAPFEYTAIFAQNRLIRLKELLDKEGEGVFEQCICSWALLYGHSLFLGEADRQFTYQVRDTLKLALLEGNVRGLDPRIANLLQGLTSASEDDTPTILGLLAGLSGIIEATKGGQVDANV